MKNIKILIDASHSEETRVAILDNGKLQDYEFEISSKKELRGNVYLAQITKVEASLQAAFIEYGEKKQGFLPFNEISVTYFNLPPDEITEILVKQKEYKEVIKSKSKLRDKKDDVEISEISEDSEDSEDFIKIDEDIFEKNIQTIEDEDSELENISEDDILSQIESETLDYGSRFGYKIQDVLKPGQYIIVQVVKEERGNKGASLTTYITLPGRFCILMPNTLFEGGISKKITRHEDRQRLKNIIDGLNIPLNTNIIMRTACLDKTDAVIIQDYHYVANLWRYIQKKSKELKKPGLLFEEGVLIKKVIRDLYSDDTSEIIIEGKKAFETAKGFAKLIAPDISDKIIKFNHPKLSLFKLNNIDEEVRSIYSPVVFLKSGGYLVINITEALVAVDINSGRSRGRRNVEETAIKTNLEAASEIAKQIKLRDIGGLIVVDFIDMENTKNRSLVEKRIKEVLKEDRAKIQVGQISNFGLLEISRQRIKASIIERTFHICNKCQGMGYIRPLDLSALDIIRTLKSNIENRKISPASDKMILTLPSSEAFYILNHKRADLTTIENTLKTSIRVKCDDTVPFPFYKIEKDREDEESVDTVLFSEQEIEANINKMKSSHNNASPQNKPVRMNPIKEVSNFKKPLKKTSWLKKVIGF